MAAASAYSGYVRPYYTPPVGTLLAFLTEEQPQHDASTDSYELHRAVLVNLNHTTPSDWCDLADALPDLETFYDDCPDEPCKQLAALLISQTYFHLELYSSALQFALLAKDQFLSLMAKVYKPTTESADIQSQQPAISTSRTYDISPSIQQYVDRIIALAVDEYIRNKSRLQLLLSNEATSMSGSMEAISPIDSSQVEELVENIMSLGSIENEDVLKLMLGLALEACNWEKTRQVMLMRLKQSSFSLLRHFVNHHELLMTTKAMRMEVFRLVASLYAEQLRSLLDMANKDVEERLESPQRSSLGLPTVAASALDELPWYSEVLFFLDDVEGTARLLKALVNCSLVASPSSPDDCIPNVSNVWWLRAMQLAFDIISFGSPAFLSRLKEHPLLKPAEEVASGPSADGLGDDATATATENEIDPTEEEDANPDPTATPTHHNDSKHTDTTTGTMAESGGGRVNDKEGDAATGQSCVMKYKQQRLVLLEKILTTTPHISLSLKFANQKNDTDLAILDAVKAGLDGRHAVLHTALICAHALVQRGTTCDIFLRRNLEWFGKTLCWGKFVATASLGVVHQTHAEKSFRVLSTYLPGVIRGAGGNSSGPSSSNNNYGGGASGNSFSDGGSLYALGLIHANGSDKQVIDYLIEQLSSGSGAAGRQMTTSDANEAATRTTVNEVTQYGASLGLGLAAMGSGSVNLYEALKSVLLMDSAVSGEAAAIGLGLVMIGTGNPDVIEDLLQYAKDTRHEKIIRACALAVALVCFKCEEESNYVIEKCLNDCDPLIRYGGCFTLGLAYCGTARETALRQLLHVAVSDPSNDVRRAAVLSISYILCNVPEQAPRVLRLLADSFNMHVRFGAILALGISCAGTASTEALSMLVTATKDAVDVVRQAAFISLGFVMMQCSEKYSQDLKKSAMKDGTTSTPTPSSEQTTTLQTSMKDLFGRKKHRSNIVGLSELPTPSEIREHLIAVSTEPKEDPIARVGAIIGLGLLDAGGRNVTCSFLSHRGLLRREAIVGFVLFSQYWYWYPFLLTISLSMVPTALIGLNGDLKIPASYCVESQAPPSQFAYPERYVQKKRETPQVTTTSVLSAVKRRGLSQKKPLGTEGTAAGDTAAPVPAAAQSQPAEQKTGEASNETEASAAVVSEPATQVIPNMSRLVPMQMPLVKPIPKLRYTPIFNRRRLKTGIIVLVDSACDEPETFLS